MSVLLDTSVIIDFLRGKAEVVDSVKQIPQNEAIYVTAISIFELFIGIFKKGLVKEESDIRLFLSQLNIIDLDSRSAEESAKVLSLLQKGGHTVNSLDTLITGTAIANGVNSILTEDKDFKEIEKVTNIKVTLIGSL